MPSMQEIIRNAEKVKPVGMTENGAKIVSFEDQRSMSQLNIVEGGDFGQMTMNADGTVARPYAPYLAVNLDSFYINRYKKVGKKLYIVTDYRAIKEQATGMVYAKTIPCYVVARGEDGKLFLEKVVNVSDTDFIADFTHTLKHEAMQEVLPVLAGGGEVTADELSI